MFVLPCRHADRADGNPGSDCVINVLDYIRGLDLSFGYILQCIVHYCSCTLLAVFDEAALILIWLPA